MIRVELFALATERPREELGETLFELRDLLFLLLDGGVLLCDDRVMLRERGLLLQTQRLQGSDILRERLGVRAHAAIDA